MGNLFTKSSATTPKDTVTDMEVSNLKLEAAKITEFHGRIDDFQAWRIRTECAFDGSGFERILTDQPFSMANPRMNRIVFSQLSVATANGDAYHLVLKHNNTKNGHGAWNELLNWYDGDAVRSETADTLRVKLHNLKLREPTSGSQYINCFNQYIHHLDRIHGEGMSESHKIQIFIRNIEDDDYMDVALHLRNSEVQSLEKAISAIRKRERDLREIKGKRKTPFLTRRIDQSEIAPEWQTQIRAANDGMGRPIRRLDTVRLTQGGYIKPPKGTWYTNDMPEDHKTFVQEWNAKVAHGEDPNSVNVPKGITVLPPKNKWAHKARRLAEQANSVAITPSPTPAAGKRNREETPSFGRKRITFGLEHSQQEADE